MNMRTLKHEIKGQIINLENELHRLENVEKLFPELVCPRCKKDDLRYYALEGNIDKLGFVFKYRFQCSNCGNIFMVTINNDKPIPVKRIDYP